MWGKLAPMIALCSCLASACTYTEVRQSSLVPVPAMPPPMRPRGLGDVYLGDSILTYVGSRDLAVNSGAALWLPSHQLDGALTLRIGRFFALRPLFGISLPNDATPAAPTTLPNPGRASGWGGLGTIVVYQHESGFGFDLEADTSILGIANWIQWRTCEPGWWDEPTTCTDWTDGRNHTFIPMLAGTLRLRWLLAEWITVFGGVTVRNHPTNRGAFSVSGSSPASSVELGDAVVVVGLGAEIVIEDVFSIIPQITWPAHGGPVTYGPMIGLGLRLRFGDPRWDRGGEDEGVKDPAAHEPAEPPAEGGPAEATDDPVALGPDVDGARARLMGGRPLWMD